jgi:hypothetical protein
LTKTNESFNQYSKEMNSKVNSLRRERTIWQIVAIVAGVFAVVK